MTCRTYLQLGYFIILVVAVCCQSRKEYVYFAPKAYPPPIINGVGDDPCWENAQWAPIEYRWLGDAFEIEDFQGKYKAVWSEERLYLLIEIVDDTLVDTHPDGLEFYWDDDCVEIFIDEDNSGGNHQYNHNAFAYHVGLDNAVVDVGPDSAAHYYTHHIASRFTSHENIHLWEMAITVYGKHFSEDSKENIPAELILGKVMGFAVAYCDNDNSHERENLIGSIPITGPDKNLGWVTADVFGEIKLVE